MSNNENDNTKELKKSRSKLIKERAILNRNLKITSIMQKPFKQNPVRKQVGLFDKTSFYKTPTQIQREEEKKLKKFRMGLKNQLREKEQLEFEKKLEDQRQEKKFEKRYNRQIQELQKNFQENHDLEKPSVSKLRNPQAHKDYERRVKIFKKKQREIEQKKKKIMRQESLFTDLMDDVMNSKIKSRHDLEKQNFINDDILDRLMEEEREKETEKIKDGIGYVIDNDMQDEFKRQRALLSGLDEVASVSSFKRNYNNLKDLENFFEKRKVFDCRDLEVELDIGEEVYFPRKSFGKVYSLKSDKEKEIIFQPLKFKKHLQSISLRSSWAQSESLMGY